MSIQSTYRITREDAEQKLISELTKKIANVKNMTDTELEDEIQDTFRNFDIVKEYGEDSFYNYGYDNPGNNY